jgi:hypothetical protein
MDQDDFGEKLQPWMHKMQEDVLKPVRWIQSQVRDSRSLVLKTELIYLRSNG